MIHTIKQITVRLYSSKHNYLISLRSIPAAETKVMALPRMTQTSAGGAAVNSPSPPPIVILSMDV